HGASLVAVLTNRASMLRQVGRVPDALRDYATALDHAERVHGARHPSVATLHVNLGQLTLLTGDAAGAYEHMRAAVAIRVAVLGRDDTQTARAEHGLGKVELALGRVDDAERSFIRAREILARAPDEALSSYPEVGLAQVDLARGDVSDALRRLERATPAIEDGGPWFSRAEAYRTIARAHLANENEIEAHGFELAAIAAYGRAGPAYYDRARDGFGEASIASTAVSGSSR
ncbi:MAG: tetratricopeptide repeat protein, partial [Myxococcota bacterium]